jgi:hypothetical protein
MNLPTAVADSKVIRDRAERFADSFDAILAIVGIYRGEISSEALSELIVGGAASFATPPSLLLVGWCTSSEALPRRWSRSRARRPRSSSRRWTGPRSSRCRTGR